MKAAILEREISPHRWHRLLAGWMILWWKATPSRRGIMTERRLSPGNGESKKRTVLTRRCWRIPWWIWSISPRRMCFTMNMRSYAWSTESRFCAKSLSPSRNGRRRNCLLWRRKNLLIAEAMWTRYMPSRQMIQDVIDSGVVGEITSMAANLGYEHINIERMRRPELAGGALMDLGVYPLHFALMFFGDQIKEITSTCVKLETGVDAQESMTLIYEDGRMAVLYSSMLVHCNRLGEINGTKGCIEVQNINNCEGNPGYWMKNGR